jgi:hypothetical protein
VVGRSTLVGAAGGAGTTTLGAGATGAVAETGAFTGAFTGAVAARVGGAAGVGAGCGTGSGAKANGVGAKLGRTGSVGGGGGGGGLI